MWQQFYSKLIVVFRTYFLLERYEEINGRINHFFVIIRLNFLFFIYLLQISFNFYECCPFKKNSNKSTENICMKNQRFKKTFLLWTIPSREILQTNLLSYLEITHRRNVSLLYQMNPIMFSVILHSRSKHMLPSRSLPLK